MAAINAPVRTASKLAAAFGGSVFREVQAAEFGVTRARLRTAVAQGLVIRVAHAHYAMAPSRADWHRAEYLLRVASALDRHPDATASHESAAAALGMPNPRGTRWTSLPTTVTRPVGVTRLRNRLRIHVATVDPMHVVETPWGPSTGLTRTAVDLCRTLPLPQALVAVDAAARELSADHTRAGLLDPANRELVRACLAECCESLRLRPGYRKAEKAAAYAEPSSESPAESLSRGWIIRAGLPVPRVGLPVLGASGRTYYGDLVWSREQVIGEVDGLLKYDSPDVLIREKNREDDLRRAGWTVVRWTGAEIYRDPARVVERVRAVVCGPRPAPRERSTQSTANGRQHADDSRR